MIPHNASFRGGRRRPGGDTCVSAVGDKCASVVGDKCVSAVGDRCASSAAALERSDNVAASQESATLGGISLRSERSAQARLLRAARSPHSLSSP